MKIKHLLSLLVACFVAHSALCQTGDPIVGTWKGSSLCQDKNSACHDEVAVYHATKLTATTYRFQMNKVVNGKEEEMGPLVFTWDEAKKTLTATNTSPKGVGAWSFRLDGNKIHGSLTVENTLFRLIELQKE